MTSIHDPEPAGIARRIREHRLQAGLTQDELARLLETTRQTVSNWERAQTIPDALMLKRLAARLGTTTDELLGERAPDTFDRTRHARRELASVTSALMITIVASAYINMLFIEQPDAPAFVALNALRIGAGAVLVLWTVSLRRRMGVWRMRQVTSIAATTLPEGSAIWRALTFLGRWWWTSWLGLHALATLAGGLTALALGMGDVEPASVAMTTVVMAAPALVARSWEAHQSA